METQGTRPPPATTHDPASAKLRRQFKYQERWKLQFEQYGSPQPTLTHHHKPLSLPEAGIGPSRDTAGARQATRAMALVMDLTLDDDKCQCSSPDQEEDAHARALQSPVRFRRTEEEKPQAGLWSRHDAAAQLTWSEYGRDKTSRRVSAAALLSVVVMMMLAAVLLSPVHGQVFQWQGWSSARPACKACAVLVVQQTLGLVVALGVMLLLTGVALGVAFSSVRKWVWR